MFHKGFLVDCINGCFYIMYICTIIKNQNIMNDKIIKPIPSISYIANQVIKKLIDDKAEHLSDILAEHYAWHKEDLIEDFENKIYKEIEKAFENVVTL